MINHVETTSHVLFNNCPGEERTCFGAVVIGSNADFKAAITSIIFYTVRN